MTAHDHRDFVEGCFRCDLSRAEVLPNGTGDHYRPPAQPSRTQKQIAKITRWSWPLYAALVPLAAWNAWLCRDNGINAALGWVFAGVAFATLAGFCRALHNLVTAVNR